MKTLFFKTYFQEVLNGKTFRHCTFKLRLQIGLYYNNLVKKEYFLIKSDLIQSNKLLKLQKQQTSLIQRRSIRFGNYVCVFVQCTRCEVCIVQSANLTNLVITGRNGKKVLRQSSDSHQIVLGQSSDSPQILLRQSSESPQKVLRSSIVLSRWDDLSIFKYQSNIRIVKSVTMNKGQTNEQPRDYRDFQFSNQWLDWQIWSSAKRMYSTSFLIYRSHI